MTEKEQKTLDNMLNIVQTLKDQNDIFQKIIQTQVDTINTKVEQKFEPLSLEKSIVVSSQQAIHESIKKVLVDTYNSPLKKLVEEVIISHKDQLLQIINESFELTITDDYFKKSILEAFNHKLAKTIISNNDSLLDKVTNQLKQDPIFKSKITLAISNIIDEQIGIVK